MNNETIILDVGGTTFKTYKKTLTDNSGYFRALLNFDDKKRIFIDRDPGIFRVLLNCFRNRAPIPMQYYDEADFYLCDVIANRVGVAVAMNGVQTRLPAAHYAGLYAECVIDIDSEIVINGVVIPLCAVRPYENTYPVLQNYHGALEISHNFDVPLVLRKQTCACTSETCARETQTIQTFVACKKKLCYNVMHNYPNAAFLRRVYPVNFSHSDIDVVYGAPYAGARHYEKQTCEA